MMSPRLGVVRKSMLKDPLIIKAPLGKARTRGLDVPGPDFVFGAKNNWNADGGVAGAFSSWRVQSRREHPARLDFVSLNRDAVRSGIVTSKELSQYRALRGAATRKTRISEPSDGGTARNPQADPDITFGVTNRAPSPLADLLSYEYAHKWFNEQLSRNQSGGHKKQMKPGHVTETRTSLLRRSRTLPAPPKPLRRPQVAQVAAALDTFRDPKACR
uniref:Chromosome 9 open reading frame 171 n=1 Tax=Nothobranchius korthausae TaxID=1143690 RepID=A0A1A8FLW5_9TELE